MHWRLWFLHLENDTDLGLVFLTITTNDDGIITGEEIRHDFDKDVSLLINLLTEHVQ